MKKKLFATNSEKDQFVRRQDLLYEASILMNDYERAEFLDLPKGCRIRRYARIIQPERLKLGEFVWIGQGAILDAQGGLEIGSNTQIGFYTLIFSHSSHRQAIAGETSRDSSKIVYKKTTIGQNCFIGSGAIIAPGVSIGEGVVVSPGSFVERDLPDNAVYSDSNKLSLLENKLKKLEKQIADLKNALQNGN